MLHVKRCSCGCGRPRRANGQRYSRKCHAENMKRWRKEQQKRIAALLRENKRLRAQLSP